MNKRLWLIAVASAALAALAYFLLAKPTGTADERDGGASGGGAKTAGRSEERADAGATGSPRRVDPGAGKTPDRVSTAGGQGADAGGAEQRVPFNPTPTKADPKQMLALDAKKRQAESVRVYLSGLRERVTKLNGILERLRREGQARPEQLQAIQTQVQQLTDAEPRLRAQLATLERELKEAAAKKTEPKSEQGQ